MGTLVPVREGEYRLRRVAGGRCGYAEVRVQIVAGRTVVWAVDPADPTCAQPGHDDAEVAAALTGAFAAIAALDVTGRTARITYAGMSIVDTDPSAMRATACAATATALGASFHIGYADGWHCHLDP